MFKSISVAAILSLSLTHAAFALDDFSSVDCKQTLAQEKKIGMSESDFMRKTFRSYGIKVAHMPQDVRNKFYQLDKISAYCNNDYQEDCPTSSSSITTYEQQVSAPLKDDVEEVIPKGC